MNFRDKKALLAFGRNLQKIRRGKEITQEELAYKSNISLSQIARIETGRTNPTLCTILELAKNLRVDPAELMKFKIFF
ncbi:MAG: helix-turn-helix transcriptional regulator [Bacteroidetes bacterium]|nr:helix-turn-helix transcriptional regulator [Bacteroidota bacterium]